LISRININKNNASSTPNIILIRVISFLSPLPQWPLCDAIRGLDPIIDEKLWQRAGPRLPTLKQGGPKSNL
jgi:hypothetical protein